MGIVANAIEWFLAHPGLLIAGVLLYVFVFVLSILFSSPKPGKNPLKRDTARPPKPLVTDQSERDKVLKQAFHTKRIPENLDAIVVGSGIGGLTTAGLLARSGKKVLVLEQHDQAGGCCHTFIERGYEFDVGIHYIGEMRQNTVSRLLVNQITDGQLQWIDLIDEFDHVVIGEAGKQRFYPYPTGSRDKWKKGMLKMFPNEEKALDKFLDLIKEVRGSLLGYIGLKVMSKWAVKILLLTGLINWFTKYFKYSRRTLTEVLEKLTDNKDLRAVLAYSYGDYGSLPKATSFSMHASLLNHFLYGASYPRGGASEIAFHAIPPIEKAGGKVLVRANVSKILFNKNGKAHGVRVDKTSGAVDIFAPMIISDAGAVNTFKSLLPPEIAEKSAINKLIQEKQVYSGTGAISIFVGLKGTPEELGIKPNHFWSFTGNNLDQISEDYLNQSKEAAAESDVPLLFISFPSVKDPTYSERFPGKTTCTIVTLANWEWFKDWKNDRVNKRGAEYEAIKNGLGKHAWQQALAIYPQLEDKVDYFEVGTPVTNKYYIGAPKGEIYGLDHNVKRFSSAEIIMTMRPDTDIPGLLLTGQDVMNAGFMGAMFGGLLCASRALNRNLWDDLVALKKQIAKTK